MKDLDFDELDKAVSSLMGKTTDTATAEAVPTLEVEAPQPPAVEPVVAEPAPAVVATDSKPAAPAARRGRFMDVMHSSTPRRAPATPSRTGVSIAPPDTDDANLEVPVVSVEPETPAAQVEQPETAPVVDTQEATQDWPDPLEIASGSDAPKTDEPQELAHTEPQEEANDEPESPEPEVEAIVPEVSLESPFIADAKVEKRPLGGEPTTPELELEPEKADEPEDTTGEQSTSSDVEPSTEPLADTPAEAEPMPAELSGDVVHVESDHPVTEDDSPRDKEETEAKSAPGVTSISQQYKEQASTGDQDHTAIYDVANYSEPLAHPAKKKASWLWIIWILLLLAVGVGGAITLYLMGII